MAVPVFSALVLAVTFGQLPGNSLLWSELQNTGHTLLFGVLALVTLCMLRETIAAIHKRPLLEYLVAASACLAIGIAIEWVQLLLQRDASISDVIRDLVGIVAALGVYATFDPRNNLRNGTFALACGLFVLSLYPLVNLAVVYQARQQAFPVIIDFTASWSTPFVQLQHAVLTQATNPEVRDPALDQRSACLVLDPAYYSVVSLVEPYPDWSGYDYLTLVLNSSESSAYDLVLRIHDSLHNQEYADRFNQRLRISPGENRFRIPLAAIAEAPVARDMDMARIAGLTLFAVDIASPVEFCRVVMRLARISHQRAR